ncbi:lipid-A-disaccharide synthase N-terminal domain-containing protein [Desulforhopalus sp. IMCC35007]|uniref:lipid-A-disaccharide synthase N-terminal domain-containing protein n=1 Tax=Desulforhopalus sp. IMCC35007 TaxID=2569543 RepID=UPI0010AE0A3A|nr:lipid-A-disaccharide synthase N-terminal domain-containing protein [Desulforhopalus sp. IMCC35007]TKB07616.1 lipid A biosynthesis protein [Desulforhopalus sp. IMCC35007]
MENNTLLLAVGFVGQICFSCRFIVQWIASEREKKSIIPKSFWYLSVLGGSTLLAYAIFKKDPVFIMGQSTGLFVYFRNLYFVQRKTNIVSHA